MSKIDLFEKSREGMSYSDFEKINLMVKLSITDWANVLGLSKSTLYKYKKESRKFNASSSEIIILIDELYRRGISVFNDENKFRTWMGRSNTVFNNRKPISLLKTASRIDLIKQELHNIEHGLFV